jgi:hypothetical protein
LQAQNEPVVPVVTRYIAILEDERNRLDAMARCLAALPDEFEPVTFDRADAMITWLDEHLNRVALISLDHDLPLIARPDGRVEDFGTGRMVADWLAEQTPVCPVIVHTSNENAAPGMIRVLTDGGWTYFRVYPHDDCAWVATAWVDAVRRSLTPPED